MSGLSREGCKKMVSLMSPRMMLCFIPSNAILDKLVLVVSNPYVFWAKYMLTGDHDLFIWLLENSLERYTFILHYKDKILALYSLFLIRNKK